MLALADWPAAQRSRIAGVFTDIDDTLTTEGVITADALQALHDLRGAGLHVIPITGRPVGWSEPFAAQWPVDAIVAENGAVALVKAGAGPHPNPPPKGEGTRYLSPSPSSAREPILSPSPSSAREPILSPSPSFAREPLLSPSPSGGGQGWGHALRKLYQQDETLRIANFARMQRVAQRIIAEVPGAVLARDSAGRETDIAIDHSEFVNLPVDCIAQVVRLMQDEGMNATVSSIHINGWFGDHNKLAGARWVVRELLGRELDAELERWVYVGDSTNDVLMFEHFPHSIGVANIRRFEAQLSHPPKYVTEGERGAGFAEVARALLAQRRAS